MSRFSGALSEESSSQKTANYLLNGKDNVIPWTQIFAHGWAFRVNWDLPETLLKRHKFFKRELNDLEDFSNAPGYACVLKPICEFVAQIMISQEEGFFSEILKMILRSGDADADFIRSTLDKCEYYIHNCSDFFMR